MEIYLNNAASAWPRAPGVIDAVREGLDRPLSDASRGGRGGDPVGECRQRIARLLGVDHPERIALTVNGTFALNFAIQGLRLSPGSTVVTSVTEHNSVLRPIHHLMRDRGIRRVLIGLDAEGTLDRDAFARALQQKPRLVVLNHASNVTGRIQAVAPLFQQAREAGAYTLLDASQTLGHVPVHPEVMAADLVAFTGHKGLHGPPGTGGLYVSPRLELEPTIVGGTGIRSDLELHPPEMPIRLEAGTPNAPALRGLAAALRWVEERPAEHRVQASSMERRLREGLRDSPGVHIFEDADGAERVGVISFRVEHWDVADVGFILEESFGITCRTGLHCAPLIHETLGSLPEGTIRFSVSGFTRAEEIDAAVAAIRQLAHMERQAA